MGTETDMKRTTDNIVGSYDTRIAALNDLKSGVHRTLNDLGSNREKSSKEQRAALASEVTALTREVAGMARGVTRMMREFHGNHVSMATELTESLKQFDTGVENDVSALLTGFAKKHDRMSLKLHSDLEDYVSGVFKETRGLLGGFRREQGHTAADVKASHVAWRGMTKTMAARRSAKPTAPVAGRRAAPRRKAAK